MFKNAKLLKKNDDHSMDEVDAEPVVDSCDVLLLYFSAHWCPPCRGFTPILKDFYEEVKKLKVCIIFVSSDRSETDMKDYFKSHGDYYAIPFANQTLIRELKTKCEVNGIPKLCYIRDDSCLHGDVRGLVSDLSDQAKSFPQVVKILKEIK